MTIADALRRSKAMLGRGAELSKRVPRDVLVVAIIVLASSAAFGLGYLTGESQGAPRDLSVSQTPLVDSEVLPAAAAAAPVTMPSGGQYVASKSGTRYYLPWCGGAKAIKDANKVWFASKALAEAAGYTPAANCKGI